MWAAALLVAASTAVALASRLHRLDEPPTPVFDEYHVGRFVLWIDEQMDSFDLHPPLLKMVYHAVSRALGHGGRADCGYGASDPFVADHTVPYEKCSMWQLRATPAVCGALLVPTYLLTVRRLGVRWGAATLGTALLLCDNMFFALSRLHMLDMGTVFLVALTILCALGAQDASARGGAGAPRAACLLLLNGLLLGLALASKFAMALPTVAWLGAQNLAALRSRAHDAAAEASAGGEGTALRTLLWLAVDCAIRGVGLLGGALAAYLGVLTLHFSSIPMQQWKSEHYTAAGPPYDDLGGQPCWHCVPPRSGAAPFATLWQRIDDYSKNQWAYNSKMDAHFPPGTHPFGSRWWSWPLNLRGIHFDLSSAGASAVYLVGNPVVGLSATVCVVLAIAYVAFAWAGLTREPSAGGAAAAGERRLPSVCLGLGGYLLHYLPFAFVARDCFLTYYILAQYFALLTLAIVLDMLWGGGPKGRAAMAMLALGAAAVFVYLTPLSYADGSMAEYYDRARLASVECWFDTDCWAAQATAGPAAGAAAAAGGPADAGAEAGRGGGCFDNDRLLSEVVGKPMSCEVVRDAGMCSVLEGTPAQDACSCSC